MTGEPDLSRLRCGSKRFLKSFCFTRPDPTRSDRSKQNFCGNVAMFHTLRVHLNFWAYPFSSINWQQNPLSGAVCTSISIIWPNSLFSKPDMQHPILPITTSSNSNRPTSVLPFLDVTKSLIDVCFSSLLLVFTFMMQNYIATGSPPPGSLSVLCVALLFAFSASVCEVLIRKRFPAAAGAMERLALVSIVTAFFLLMFLILPEDLRWFLLIPFLLVLVPFLHPIFSASSTGRSVVPTEHMTTDEERPLPREAIVAERVIYSVHHYLLFVIGGFDGISPQ